jgi:predicted MFS family arabinose efflux permease
MPLIGKLSDRVDKYKIFAIASCYMMVLVVIYTHLNAQPLWVVMIFNMVMMAGIFGRMVPASALTTSIPDMQDRGAFMSINASLQQIAGGVAAAVAGMIVVQKTKYSPLEHYSTLGYLIVCINTVTLWLMYRVSRMIKGKYAKPTVVQMVEA